MIGKQIELDGIGRTVIGVLPASFAFPDNNFGQDLLLPLLVGGVVRLEFGHHLPGEQLQARHDVLVGGRQARRSSTARARAWGTSGTRVWAPSRTR